MYSDGFYIDGNGDLAYGIEASYNDSPTDAETTHAREAAPPEGAPRDAAGRLHGASMGAWMARAKVHAWEALGYRMERTDEEDERIEEIASGVLGECVINVPAKHAG